MRKLVMSAVGAAAILASDATFAAITAKSYVSDGLVALWDAKENVAYGVHADAPSSWADLSGKAFAISVGSTAFTSSDFPVSHGTGRTVSAATLGSTDLYRAYGSASFTAEIAYHQDAATESGTPYNVKLGSMVSVGSYDVFIGVYADTKIGFNSYGNKGSANIMLAVSDVDTLGSHTYSCRQDGTNWSVDFDGVKSASGRNAGGPTSLAANYGFGLNRDPLYGNDGINGGYHVIRFYSRPLSDDEVSVNRAVDRIRYFDADPLSISLPIGWRFTEGADVKLEREATISVLNSAGGTIRVDAGSPTTSASLWIEQGSSTQVSIVAEPAQGYVFEGWTGEFEAEDISAAAATLVVKGDVRAVFRRTDGSDPRTYGLVNASGIWNDAGSWKNEYGFNGVPALGDKVTVGKGKTVLVTNSTETVSEIAVSGTLVITNWTTCLSATDITVQNGGAITCGPASRTMEGMSRVWIACSNLTVVAGGKVDADKKGYLGEADTRGAGPGAPVGASSNGSLAAPSHGGFGGVDQTASTKAKGALPYDDPAAPTLPGSSGRATSFNADPLLYKARGGGAVLIQATGAVVVDGDILASGENADHTGTGNASWRGEPGSGGSVFITCRTIAGAGSIRADGGWGEWPSEYAGSGLPAGGGCIAIHYDVDAQAGASVEGMIVSANAGKCQLDAHKSSNVNDLDDGKWCQADMGTLHFTDDQLVRALVGKGLTGQIRDLPSFVWDGDLVFSSGRVRFATEGVQVTVNGDLTLTGSDSRLEIGGCAATNWAHHTVLYSGTVPCGLTVNGDLTLSGTSRLDIRSAATAGHSGTGATVTVSGQMTVAANCRVYAWSDVVTLGSPAFTVGGLDLQAGALFSADARGGRGGFNGDVSAYVVAIGPKGPSCGEHGSGAGHGGRGGKGGTASGRFAGGAAYDDVLRPSIPGSGGSKYGAELTGNGGGLILVSAVNGTIRVDGTMTANGESGSLFDAARVGSGGSGGSILLEARTFVGGANGRLSAEGGSAAPGGSLRNGAGAGGRIAVWCGAPWDATARASRITVSENPLGSAYAEFFSWAGTASVAGGTSTVADSNAEAGTVRYCHMRPLGGMILVVE